MFLCDKERVFLCDKERVLLCDKERVFLCDKEQVLLCDKERVFFVDAKLHITNGKAAIYCPENRLPVLAVIPALTTFVKRNVVTARE